MRRSLTTLAVLAAAALASTTEAFIAANTICTAAETCYMRGGSRRCDRTISTNKCPPCIYKRPMSVLYECYDLDDNGKCPDTTTLCPVNIGGGGSSSGSGAGPTPTPTATTAKPTPKPTPTPTPTPSPTPTPTQQQSVSGSDSGSSSAPVPTTKKPTTKKPPATRAPTTPPPTTDTPMPDVTKAPQVTTRPANSQTTSSDSSGSKLPLIIGIAGGAVIVVAVLAFFIWKRRRDEDDDSDDDEYRFNPPKPAYNAGAGAGAGAAAGPSGSVATTASYNNSDQMRGPTSPGRGAGGSNFGAAAAGYGAGSQYGQNGGNQYGQSGGNQYGQNGGNQYGQNGGAKYGANDYGSPSTIDGSRRDVYGLPAYDNQDSLSDNSSTDDRDVWGNTVGNKPSKQAPTRTLSNVSVEF